MADTELTLDTPGTVLGTVALSTNESDVTFVGGGSPLIEIICDVEWQYLSETGGDYYSVPAATPMQLKARSFIAQVGAGTGTLRILQVG